jgi:hypothetical protein
MPVLELAARQGWWALPKHIVEQVAKLIECAITSPSLFGVLFAVTQSILKCSESEALECLAKRMAQMKSREQFAGDQILEVDAAAECLDEHDKIEVKTVQKRALENKDELETFVAAYKEKRTSAGGSKKAKVAKKGGKASAVPGYKGPKVLPPPSEIEHATAKQYMPPGSHLWRSNGTASWNARVPPFGTTSRSWRKHGEAEALRMCIVAAWSTFCDIHGLDEKDCPIENLFFKPADSGAAAASSTD